MGLTGVILDVTLRLKRIQTSYINQKTIKAKNLTEILSLFDEYHHYTYSVAWIDCLQKNKNLGRSILMLGEHSKLEDLNKEQRKTPFQVHPNKQVTIPFNFPSFTLNKNSVRLFNYLYYHKQPSRETTKVVHYDSYFFPLDKIGNWNRIYGVNGFTQYQFVLPFEKGKKGLHKIMSKIASSGCEPFLVVLKTFSQK